MAASTVQQTPWRPKRPYADEIERVYGKEYQHLCKFLREGYKTSKDSTLAITYSHDFWIADRVKGVFNERHFSAKAVRGAGQSSLTVWPDFAQAIRDRTAEVDLRVVLTTCRSLSAVNEAYIDDFAEACDLPPDFLACHFDRLGRRTPRVKDHLILLASEREWLQLLNVGDCTMTCSIQRNKHGFLVVIMSMGSSKATIQGPFPFINGLTSHLRNMNRSSDQAPMEILYSFVRSMIVQAERIRRNLLKDFEGGLRVEKAVQELRTAQRQRDGLRYSRDSLAEYVKLPEEVIGPSSNRLESLVAEYDRMISNMGSVVADQQALLGHEVALISIEEAVKGIQSADSVRRLTVIAFIFIPMNFATSFFGMNVKQLDTGTVNIGFFFLLAIGIGLVSYVLTLLVKPLERSWAEHKKRVTSAAATEWRVYSKWTLFGFWLRWHWNNMIGRKNSQPPSSSIPVTDPLYRL